MIAGYPCRRVEQRNNSSILITMIAGYPCRRVEPSSFGFVENEGNRQIHDSSWRNQTMATAPTTRPQFPTETRPSGEFVRQEYTIRDRITADGSSGFKAEPGRYHLYVSLACPWAHRAVIVRRLLGLEETISMSVVDPIRDEKGWAFRKGPGYGPDPVNGFAYLSEAYLRTDPDYTGRYTVPCIWDRETGRSSHQQLPRHHD